MRIIISYTAKWRLKDNPNYLWTECKKLVNNNTGKEIKKTIKGIQAGYYLSKKFIKLSELKDKIELIPKKEWCPF